MPDTMTVNGAEYTVIKLLGKGKGGYSYLVTDGTTQYVLKQIHHEPCEYYAFVDKLHSELRDYETLRKIGIPMPRLLEVDTTQERILKEYIAGATVAELLKEGRMEPDWLAQVQAMCSLLYPAGLNIDYYHSSGHYQYNWKWTDPLTEGSGCKLIRKQLRPVYRRRWYAIKRSGTQS